VQRPEIGIGVGHAAVHPAAREVDFAVTFAFMRENIPELMKENQAQTQRQGDDSPEV